MIDRSRAFPSLPVGVALLLLICLIAPLRAQTREEIEQRNQQLEQQYQSEQPPPSNLAPATPYGGSGDAEAPRRGGSAPGLTSQLLSRVQVLEDQVRSERGRIDDLTNQMQRQDADLSKQISDLQFKLGQGGASAAASPTSGGSGSLEAPRAAAPPADAERALRRTPERALQQGNAALARRDYPAAESAAREVLAAGASPRANDAQFLLAQSESGQGRHQQAAADFYDAYNRSPRSGRAPAALLGVATSLLALNDTRDACQAIAKIDAEFPNLSPSIHRAVVGTRARAGCH